MISISSGDDIDQEAQEDILYMMAESMYMCDEYGAALSLFKDMTLFSVYPEAVVRIADCFKELGDYGQAFTVLESITDKSAAKCHSLGSVYFEIEEYEKSEQSYLQALEVIYSEVSTERQYDYYGDPIETEEPTKNQENSLLTITSPEERLGRIVSSSPDIIICLTSLGLVYSAQGQYHVAEAYLKKVLTLISEVYGDGAAIAEAAAALGVLGDNYTRMGKYCEAEIQYKKSLAIYRTLSHGDDSNQIAHILYKLSITYNSMQHGRVHQGRALLNRNLAYLWKVATWCWQSFGGCIIVSISYQLVFCLQHL